MTLLLREAGLFPEAVVDPRGEDVDGDADDLVTVGEFEEMEDARSAARVLTEAGVWFRERTHPEEEWQRTSIEVKVEDQERALDAMERLLEDDASSL